MTRRRRAITVALAAVIAVVVPAAIAPAISHAAAYRYWSYWLGSDDGWSFASVGPAFRVPADGTVEGWRFAVSGVQGNHAPSIAADFDAVCGTTSVEDGRKRVAVIVDPGVAADAPEGEQPPGAWAMCVVAEQRATGYDVLRAATTVRAERGLICGIGGYPAGECAEVTADPAPAPTPTKAPKPTKSPKPTASPQPTAPVPAPTSPATSGGTPATSSPEPNAAVTASDVAAAATQADQTSTPAPDPTTAAPSTSSAAPSTLTPSPEPSYSLLTTPLDEPPTQGGGAGGALVAGIAVVGIAGLGGAAIMRMRRSS